MPAILFREESDDDRGHERYRVRLGAVRVDMGADVSELTVHDVSASGILLETDQELATGFRILVEFEESLRRQAQIVWTSNNFYGVKFAEGLSPAELVRIISASDVVWPNFRDLKHPASRDLWQGRDVFDTAAFDAAADDHDGFGYDSADKLPLPARLRTIFGMAALPWAVIGGGIWLALG